MVTSNWSILSKTCVKLYAFSYIFGIVVLRHKLVSLRIWNSQTRNEKSHDIVKNNTNLELWFNVKTIDVCGWQSNCWHLPHQPNPGIHLSVKGDRLHFGRTTASGKIQCINFKIKQAKVNTINKRTLHPPTKLQFIVRYFFMSNFASKKVLLSSRDYYWNFYPDLL